MASPCTYDGDCPLPGQACYTNVSWYVAGPGENGCICSTFYGFSGLGCDQVLNTTTSRFWLGMGILILILLCINIALATQLLIRLKRYRHFQISAETVGSAQVILGGCFGIICQSGYISGMLLPDLAGFTLTPTSERQNLHHSTWNSFYALFLVTVIFGALTIALIWIDVASKVSKMSRSAATIKSYQLRMTVFETVAIICIIIPIAIGSQTFAFIIGFLIALVLIGLYTYGYWHLSGIIQKFTSSSSDVSPYKKVLTEMYKVILWIYASVTVAAALDGSLLALIVLGWKDSSTPNGLSALVVVTEFSLLAMVSIQFGTIALLRLYGKRQLSKDNSSVAVIDSGAQGDTYGSSRF